MHTDFKDVKMCVLGRGMGILESVKYHAFIGCTWLNSRLKIYRGGKSTVLKLLRDPRRWNVGSQGRESCKTFLRLEAAN